MLLLLLLLLLLMMMMNEEGDGKLIKMLITVASLVINTQSRCRSKTSVKVSNYIKETHHSLSIKTSFMHEDI